MNYKTILLSVILLTAATFSTLPAYAQLGVNLSGGGAFVNIVNHSARYVNCTEFDEHGWPAADFEYVLMDNRPVAEWNGVIDDPEEYRTDQSGTWHCSFLGAADISLWGSGASILNMTYDESANTTYFDIEIPGPPGEGHGFIYLTFSNTQRSPEGPTSSGISNIKVMRPGYELSSDKIFTDEYIALCKSADFECFRYYAVQNIWECEPEWPAITSWENRKTPEDCAQTSLADLNGKADGWCWEYIIELANMLNRDIWICIPISCDSIYVVNLATKLRDELNPGINIYVENSNEVWSPTHMTHGPYNQAQAESYGISFMENHARRTVWLSRLFASVFGQEAINKRLRVILAGQHSYSGRHDYHLNYINDNIGAPADYIYALSTALYFGSDNPDGSPEEINQGMTSNINEQINDPDKSTYRMNHIERNTQWGFKGKCTSYEGGPSLPSGGNLDNLDNQIMANRTEAMRNILVDNYDKGWFDIGGGLALYFILSGSYQRYGCWGLTDDYTNPERNYKMQAMRDLAGTWSSIRDNASPDSDILVYPNPAHSYINIELENSQVESVEIFNLAGESIGIMYIKAGHIDLGNVPPGVYMLKIWTEKRNDWQSALIVVQ